MNRNLPRCAQVGYRIRTQRMTQRDPGVNIALKRVAAPASAACGVKPPPLHPRGRAPRPEGYSARMAGYQSARRRLRGVCHALAGATAIDEPLMRQLPPMAAMPEQASLSADGLVLLKDEQVQTFCSDGFLLVQPSSLSRQFHAEMVQQLDDSAERGNNIVGKAPDLMRVYTDPASLGAARSLCGPGCDVHSHRHAHLTVGSLNNVGAQQTWHKVRSDYQASR